MTNSISAGMLTNVRDMVIAPYQQAAFSTKTKTASYRNGAYQFITESGAYRFATFVIQDHATVKFQATGNVLSLGFLELHYGAVLYGERLLLESNDVILHPGSVMNLTGGGYAAGTGPGAGSMVGIYRNSIRISGKQSCPICGRQNIL